MNKEEIIAKAYGEYWGTVKDYVDDNGLLPYDSKHETFDIVCKYANDEIERKQSMWRPISLQGIETNNGWVKIESEEQYETLENGEYEWYNIHNDKYDKGDLWDYGVFTHYKIVPIVKPKPPLY